MCSSRQRAGRVATRYLVQDGCKWLDRPGWRLSPGSTSTLVARVSGWGFPREAARQMANATLTPPGPSGKLGELPRMQSLLGGGRAAVGACFLRTQQGV